jgi:hypothetical protein
MQSLTPLAWALSFCNLTSGSAELIHLKYAYDTDSHITPDHLRD